MFRVDCLLCNRVYGYIGDKYTPLCCREASEKRHRFSKDYKLLLVQNSLSLQEFLGKVLKPIKMFLGQSFKPVQGWNPGWEKVLNKSCFIFLTPSP